MLRQALVVVAGLGLGIAGCGDDVTGIDMPTPDLAMRDMAVNNDLAMIDMAVNPGTSQMTLGDIVGTFYKAEPAGACNPQLGCLPRTHILFAQASFPGIAGTHDYTDSDFSGTGGAVHGCLADRYDLTAGKGPNPDVDAGTATFTGYNTVAYAFDSRSVAAPYNPPIPASINCGIGATLPYYGCIFGGPSTDMNGNIEGESPLSIVFPSLPPGGAGGTTCPPGTGPLAATGCEQHLLIPGTTVVTESIVGSTAGTTNGYGAKSAMVPGQAGATLPTPLTIVSINGAAPASAGDPLGGITAANVDGTTDLVIKWSCDGTATPGAGCPTGATGFLDLAGLIAIVSTQPRTAFAITPKYGSAQCVEQLGSASSTMTLRKEAITAMLGTQVNGSILLVVSRLKASAAASMGHTMFFTAGNGDFAFIKR